MAPSQLCFHAANQLENRTPQKNLCVCVFPLIRRYFHTNYFAKYNPKVKRTLKQSFFSPQKQIPDSL